MRMQNKNKNKSKSTKNNSHAITFTYQVLFTLNVSHHSTKQTLTRQILNINRLHNDNKL